MSSEDKYRKFGKRCQHIIRAKELMSVVNIKIRAQHEPIEGMHRGRSYWKESYSDLLKFYNKKLSLLRNTFTANAHDPRFIAMAGNLLRKHDIKVSKCDLSYYRSSS